MTGFAALCKTADEAIAARDEYFSRKFKNPEFAKRVQNIRDFASTKRNNEVLTIDGREYTSVKDFFKAELGVTYEYIRRLGERGKSGACTRLFTDSKPKAMGTEIEINVPQEETLDLPEIPDAQTPIQPAAQETPIPQQLDKRPPSLDERVRHAVHAVQPFMKFLSPQEADEFMTKFYDTLQSDHGFDDSPVVQVTDFGTDAPPRIWKAGRQDRVTSVVSRQIRFQNLEEKSMFTMAPQISNGLNGGTSPCPTKKKFFSTSELATEFDARITLRSTTSRGSTFTNVKNARAIIFRHCPNLLNR